MVLRFHEGSAPRTRWRRGTTTHPPHIAPGPAERASTVQPTLLPPRSGIYVRGKKRAHTAIPTHPQASGYHGSSPKQRAVEGRI